MNTKQSVLAFTLALAAASWAVPAWAASATVKEAARQRVQELEKQRAEQDAFLKKLDEAFAAEARNEAWASGKEAELKLVHAEERKLRGAVLRDLHCRASQGRLVYQLSADPKQAIEQQQPIREWVSGSEPCGYTLSALPPTGEGTPGQVRLYLQCKDE